MFYTDLILVKSSYDPENLFQQIEKNPAGTGLTTNFEFKKLDKGFPGKFYLIYANRAFAYFTSKKNQKNVVYNLSDRELLPVR